MNKKERRPKMSRSRKPSKIRRQSYASIVKTVKELNDLGNPTSLTVDGVYQMVLNMFSSKIRNTKYERFVLDDTYTTDPRQIDYTAKEVKKWRDTRKIIKIAHKDRFKALCKRLAIERYGEDIFAMYNTKVGQQLHRDKYAYIKKKAYKKQFDLTPWEKLSETGRKETVYEALGKEVEKATLPPLSQTVDMSPAVAEYVITKSKNSAKKALELVTENIERSITRSTTTYSKAA